MDGPVFFTISDRYWVLGWKVRALAIHFEVAWRTGSITDTIHLDFGVLFLLEFNIFVEVGTHWNLVRHKAGEDVEPVSPTRLRREDPDLRRKAVLARDEPGPCIAILASDLEVDRLLLGVGRDFHVVVSLALGERSKPHLELHFVLLDLLLARLGDLFSQVFVAVVIVRPVRVPVFLKLNEGKEAGLLC